MKTLYIWGMISDENTALELSAKLLQIKAIKLQPSDPFTWASGWKSPIYCDNRIILSHPEVRGFVRDKLAKQLKNLYPQANCIAGVATGAIAMGVLVADVLNLPFIYVRPEPKGHGRKNQIEGQLPDAAKVVVIEDLISTGGSSLKAVAALKGDGANVLGMLAVFTYGFPIADQNFKEAKCQLHTLSNYDYLLEKSMQNGEFNDATLETLKTWRHNPSEWLTEA